MLIITEENKKLKGTKYRLPQKLVDRYRDILINYSMYADKGGYTKAKNILKKGGIVTMEWLKNMKAFFQKHPNETDIDFILGGGSLVKYYVEYKLEQLTRTYGRAERKTNPAKPRQDTSSISGNRGDKSSKSLSIANKLMSGLIPKVENKEKNKTLIITESQLIKIKKLMNK